MAEVEAAGSRFHLRAAVLGAGAELGGFQRRPENEAFAEHTPHHATAQVPPPDFLVWLLSVDDTRARI